MLNFSSFVLSSPICGDKNNHLYLAQVRWKFWLHDMGKDANNLVKLSYKLSYSSN